MDVAGKLGFSQLNIATVHEDKASLTGTRAPTPALDGVVHLSSPGPKYAPSPTRAQFAVGIFGAILYACRQCLARVILVKRVHAGHAFVKEDPNVFIWAGALGCGGAIHRARNRRLHRQLLSLLGRAGRSSKAIASAMSSRTTCVCRPPTSIEQQSGHAAVEAHQQHRAGGCGAATECGDLRSSAIQSHHRLR